MSAPASAASAASGPVLRDIHVPPSPSWWPLAPGWWVLAVLLLAVIVVMTWWWLRRRQHRRDESMVLSELDALAQRWRDQPIALATGLHQLMRRVALRYDATAGQRQGAAWRDTLAKVSIDAATLDQLMSIEQAMYRPGVSLHADKAIDATRRWLIRAWRYGRNRGVAVALGKATEAGRV